MQYLCSTTCCACDGRRADRTSSFCLFRLTFREGRIFSGSLHGGLLRFCMPVKGQKWEGQVRKMEVGEQVPQQDLVGHKVDKVMIGGVVVGLGGELCVTCPGLDSQLPDSRLDSGLPARESSDLPFPSSQLIAVRLVTDSPNPLCLQLFNRPRCSRNLVFELRQK